MAYYNKQEMGKKRILYWLMKIHIYLLVFITPHIFTTKVKISV